MPQANPTVTKHDFLQAWQMLDGLFSLWALQHSAAVLHFPNGKYLRWREGF